jgi:hypothetical protein
MAFLCAVCCLLLRIAFPLPPEKSVTILPPFPSRLFSTLNVHAEQREWEGKGIKTPYERSEGRREKREHAGGTKIVLNDLLNTITKYVSKVSMSHMCSLARSSLPFLLLIYFSSSSLPPSHMMG